MRCPSCLHSKSDVTDSRPREAHGDEITWRRRKCRRCRFEWSTFEDYELADPEAAFVLADIARLIDSHRANTPPDTQ